MTLSVSACQHRTLGTGKGKAGRVNVSESPKTPRYVDSRWRDAGGGRAGTAAGRRQVLAGVQRPAGSEPPSPGSRRHPPHPPRPHLGQACRNVTTPLGSGRPAVRPAGREEGSTPQRAQEGPGSERRRPKGSGKPAPRTGSSASGSRITGRTGAGAPARKGADAGLVGLRRKASAAAWRPLPVRRVYVPKRNGKRPASGSPNFVGQETAG